MNERIKELLLSEMEEDFQLGINILEKEGYEWTIDKLDELSAESKDWEYFDNNRYFFLKIGQTFDGSIAPARHHKLRYWEIDGVHLHIPDPTRTLLIEEIKED